ncbi:MAG TPA: ABC transporter substrate-binding protein, partial [Paenibacillus sp.]|nr:ABC transporter substrate-binding protein [Paenibacillus sp.]
QMYKDGLIDKEFALRKADDTNALIASGKAGAVFGPWWIPWWPLGDSVANDPKAEWRAYAVPLGANGVLNTPMAALNNNFIAVKKGFAHPEAVIKVLNVQHRALSGLDTEIVKRPEEAEYREIGAAWSNWPFPLSIDFYDAIEKRAKLVNEVLDGKRGEGDLANASDRGWYDLTVQERENPKKDVNAWAHSVVVTSSGLAMAEPMNTQYGEFYGVTESMASKSAVLTKLENETFLRIITGESSVDEFDAFVEQWKSLGGDQITEEVRSAVAN